MDGMSVYPTTMLRDVVYVEISAVVMMLEHSNGVRDLWIIQTKM